jgi:hypothetical protein
MLAVEDCLERAFSQAEVPRGGWIYPAFQPIMIATGLPIGLETRP